MLYYLILSQDQAILLSIKSVLFLHCGSNKTILLMTAVKLSKVVVRSSCGRHVLETFSLVTFF